MTTRPAILLAPDCGPGVGSGHLERALALAEELSPAADVALVVPPHQTSIQRARARGVSVVTLAADISDRVLRTTRESRPRVLVLDGYGFDLRCQAELRTMARVVLVDDLSQACDADLAVNPAPGGEAYLHPRGADRVLAGAAYAIMSRAYTTARDVRASQQPSARRLLVVSGAADVGGILAEIVAALDIDSSEVDVVIGPDAARFQARPGVTIHRAPPDLAGLLSQSTLYIGAAGTSAVQAAAVGVPLLICPVAENQIPQARALERFGAAVVVTRDSGSVAMAREAAVLLADPARLQLLGTRGATMVDARGAQRVAAEVLQLAAAGAGV